MPQGCIVDECLVRNLNSAQKQQPRGTCQGYHVGFHVGNWTCGGMWQAPLYVPRTSLPALAGLREDLCPARGQLPSWTAHFALWRSLRCRWWYKCNWVQLSAIGFPILIEDTRWYKSYMPYACFGLFWCKSMSNCFVDWHPCALPWVDTLQCDLAMKSQNRISDCWPKKRCVRFIASRFLKGLHYGNRHR